MALLVHWENFQAVLFDLDGVLTDTASIHAAAWKATFDDFLQRREGDGGEQFVPFDASFDYLAYVDGRPRFEGVDTFLRSRHIELPWGVPTDPPGDDSVCAIGNTKNQLVGRMFSERGVEVYPGSRRLVEALAARGKVMAVVTSSANASVVLHAAGLDELFPVRVDGTLAAELGLRGKPYPDPFLTAADLLGVRPQDTVVVEDAISGVKAGRAGGFGRGVGVIRHGDPSELQGAGADLVVADLEELVPG
ncbi:MAG: HAD family hydrolase [Actinomycetota bacterium]